MEQKQQQLGDQIDNLQYTHICNFNTEMARRASKLTPKTSVHIEINLPITFLEALKYYWETVKTTREQTAFIMGSCLHGTPKDWWDLVKEDDDNLGRFCEDLMQTH